MRKACVSIVLLLAFVMALVVPSWAACADIAGARLSFDPSGVGEKSSGGRESTLIPEGAVGVSSAGWSGKVPVGHETDDSVTAITDAAKTLTASLATDYYGEPKSTHTWLHFPADRTQVWSYDVDVCIDAFPPTPSAAWLYFFAIQTNFSDGGGGAHGGLQWASGGQKANWGGYDLRHRGDIQSIVIDHSWTTGTWYRYHVAREVQRPDGTWAWGFWITDLSAGTQRYLGKVYSKGSSISGCVVWMETGYGVVATTPRAQVRWRNPVFTYGASQATGHPVAGYATYNGTCIEPHTTDQQLISRDPCEWIQLTNAPTRTNPANTYIWKDTDFGVTVSADPSAGGTVSKSPDQPFYPSGTVVTLTATPSPGWHFSGWSGDATGSANPATIVVDGDKLITALFIPEEYVPDVTPPTLTVSGPEGSMTTGVSGVADPDVSFTEYVNSGKCSVSVLTSENKGSATVKIWIDGQETYAGVESGLTAHELLMTEGRHEVVVTATDAANNSTAARFDLVVDTQGPDINLEVVPAMTFNRQLVVRGTVHDTVSGVVSVKVEGGPVLVIDGVFSSTVLLARGMNRVPVTAVDRAGNMTQAELVVSLVEVGLPPTVLRLTIGSLTMYVDGNPVSLDSAPVIREGRTMLPIRAIAESIDAHVVWEAGERKVTIAHGMTTIELRIGDNSARVNGEAVQIDDANSKVVPYIANGRTMLPIRFIAEALGMDVEWNASTRMVVLTMQP